MLHQARLADACPTKTVITALLGTRVVQESGKGLNEFNVVEHLDSLIETVPQTHHAQKDIDLVNGNTLISKFSP